MMQDWIHSVGINPLTDEINSLTPESILTCLSVHMVVIQTTWLGALTLVVCIEI